MKISICLALVGLVATKPSKHCTGENNPNVKAKTKTCPEPGTLIDDIKNGDEQGLREGDIIPRPGESEENRNMFKLERYKWPRSMDGNVYIPYDDSYINDKVRNAFLAGVQNYNEVSCIRFIKRTDETDYVELTRNSGCFSGIGRWKGKQRLNLSDRCADFHGIVLHEMLHTVGFMHEHTRADRDQYVTIHWENLCDNCEGNFKKADPYFFDTFGTAYDYDSVMHYDEYTGSKNGEMVIVPKQDVDVGQRLGFSTHDIEKLNMLYHCNEDPTTPVPTTTSTRAPTTTTQATSRRSTTTTQPLPTTTEKCPNLKSDRYCTYHLGQAGSVDAFCNTSQWTTTAAYCPKTCGRCDDETTATGNTTTTTTTSGGTTNTGCDNTKSDRYCEYWLGEAGSMNAFCNDRQWTTTAQYCPKTCSRC